MKIAPQSKLPSTDPVIPHLHMVLDCSGGCFGAIENLEPALRKLHAKGRDFTLHLAGMNLKDSSPRKQIVTLTAREAFDSPNGWNDAYNSVARMGEGDGLNEELAKRVPANANVLVVSDFMVGKPEIWKKLGQTRASIVLPGIQDDLGLRKPGMFPAAAPADKSVFVEKTEMSRLLSLACMHIDEHRVRVAPQEHEF